MTKLSLLFKVLLEVVMNKATEKKLLNKRWVKMRSELKAFLDSGKQEDLHQFRIRIKKIRSLLFLFTITSTNHLLKDFKPVKKIYKHAGMIRELHIYLQLAEQYQIEHQEFRNEQKCAMKDQWEEFERKGKMYLKTLAHVFKKLEKDIHPISNKRITNFYADHLNNIIRILAKREFSDEMHDCRKRIKNILYNQEIVKKTLERKLELNMDYLDQLQDEIGKWHDAVLAFDLFSEEEQNDKAALMKLQGEIKNKESSVISLSYNSWLKLLKSPGYENTSSTTEKNSNQLQETHL